MAFSFFERWFGRLHAAANSRAVPGALSRTTDAETQFSLAQALKDGNDSDQAQAVQWYRKAAEQGHCAAQFNLAQMHAQGKGGLRDEAAALAWLRRAAQAGHGGAQYHLGVRLHRASKYKTGSEASELRIESLGWLHQAVAQSWPGAESAYEFVLLGMTKQEAKEGEHRAKVFMANPASNTPPPPVLEPSSTCETPASAV